MRIGAAILSSSKDPVCHLDERCVLIISGNNVITINIKWLNSNPISRKWGHEKLIGPHTQCNGVELI